MTATGNPGLVVFRRTGPLGDIDAIDEHSRRLVAALREHGLEVDYEPRGLRPAVDRRPPPAWILVQYNPFRYGRWGFAHGLLLHALRLRWRRIPVILVVHEAWVDIRDPRTLVVGIWQRAHLRLLARLATGVMASTEVVADALGPDTTHLPVGSNISPIGVTRADARARLGLDGGLVVALFGRAHETRALDHVGSALARLSDGPVTVLNLGADAPLPSVPAGVRVISPGHQEEREISLGLTASDLVLLPLTDGLSTRRGTLAAALAHGRAVVGLLGQRTDTVLAEADDALVLTAAGDQRAYGEAAAGLAQDPERRARLEGGARSLHLREFAWPVIASRVARRVNELTAVEAESDRSAIWFVACDVGASGGMERQSARLVQHLLDTGRRVTVVARTCEIPPHPGLRLIRVRTPARPASVAYPAFIAAASLIVTRRAGALLHTTGAVVAGRSDVCTIHYCHRAARGRLYGSRASRPTLAYRVNSATAGALSRAAERWCYRPERIGLFSAVSAGVAAEFEDAFPAVRGRVRVIPNGVDSDAFRSDAGRRLAVRRQLGLDPGAPTALFVGGDWERKGLRHAIDALAHAQTWHLIVAGAGDGARARADAARAGAASRLHLLGPTSDVASLYAAADAFVLPTAYETFSLVTFEAAASGLPLLVTRVSGVEDLLEDGRSGWFITRDGRDIGARLRLLAQDRRLCAEMGALARSSACAFSWEAMGRGYERLYAELEPTSAAAPGSSPSAGGRDAARNSA